jgi:hypothetical protein
MCSIGPIYLLGLVSLWWVFERVLHHVIRRSGWGEGDGSIWGSGVGVVSGPSFLLGVLKTCLGAGREAASIGSSWGLLPRVWVVVLLLASTYERVGGDAGGSGVLGSDSEILSGGLRLNARGLCTFFVLLNSILGAMLLPWVLRHHGKEGYGGGECEKSDGEILRTCLPQSTSTAFRVIVPFISTQTSDVLLVGQPIIHHCDPLSTTSYFLLGALVREATSLVHSYSNTYISCAF